MTTPGQSKAVSDGNEELTPHSPRSSEFGFHYKMRFSLRLRTALLERWVGTYLSAEGIVCELLASPTG